MNQIILTRETITKLESLLLSYEVLSRYKKEKENETGDVSEGKFAIYEKLYAIVTSDPCYGLIVSELGDIFEDYIHNVSIDTPQIIRLLTEHINKTN